MDDSYFAGFFDADGTIGISGDSTLYLSVSQVHQSILDMFQARFGGHIMGPIKTKATNSRPIYRWTVKARLAEAALREIEPYLVVKADRARIGVEFAGWVSGDNVLPRGLAAKLPKNVAKRNRIITERVRLKQQMTLANRRGLYDSL